MLDLTQVHTQVMRNALTALYNAHLNQLLGDPGFAPGTDADKFKIGNAFDYRIGGVTYRKAAADDIAAPTSSDAGEFRKDLISISAAGTVTLTAGTAAASQAAAELPATPDGNLPIGYIEVPESFVSETTDVTAGMLKRYTADIDYTP